MRGHVVFGPTPWVVQCDSLRGIILAPSTPPPGTLRLCYHVRASGPRGGAFRWDYSSLRAAQRAAARWRRRWRRHAEIWVTGARLYDGYAFFKVKYGGQSAGELRAGALDAWRREAIRLAYYHARNVAELPDWKHPDWREDHAPALGREGR